MVWTRTVGTADRVPEADLREAGQVVDRMHRAEVLRAISMQRLRHLTMSSQGYDTRIDLIMLDMVNLDVILGMNWLSPYHASWIATPIPLP
ncbi:hypothetical protein MTR67_023855 [Solanum verrucosum]|uniref:Uncharacterized protein n=1 Tax=Solanum verrucosum TaxID=315347 RepID=A0AAF0QXC1_SOLVR|nr:hypothetical protein MTR67_023855 [Solanum verrucosum]